MAVSVARTKGERGDKTSNRRALILHVGATGREHKPFTGAVGVATRAGGAIGAAAVDAVVGGVAVHAGRTRAFLAQCLTLWRSVTRRNQLALTGVAAVFDEWHFVNRAARRRDIARDGACAASCRRQFTGVGASIGIDLITIVALLAFYVIDNAVAANFFGFAVCGAAVASGAVAVVADFALTDDAITTCGWHGHTCVGRGVARLASATVVRAVALVRVWDARSSGDITDKAIPTIAIVVAVAGLNTGAASTTVASTRTIFVVATRVAHLTRFALPAATIPVAQVEAVVAALRPAIVAATVATITMSAVFAEVQLTSRESKDSA